MLNPAAVPDNNARAMRINMMRQTRKREREEATRIEHESKVNAEIVAVLDKMEASPDGEAVVVRTADYTADTRVFLSKHFKTQLNDGPGGNGRYNEYLKIE
jgi:transcriptional regulator GlxA family with amidase domain